MVVRSKSPARALGSARNRGKMHTCTHTPHNLKSSLSMHKKPICLPQRQGKHRPAWAAGSSCWHLLTLRFEGLSLTKPLPVAFSIRKEKTCWQTEKFKARSLLTIFYCAQKLNTRLRCNQEQDFISVLLSRERANKSIKAILLKIMLFIQLCSADVNTLSQNQSHLVKIKALLFLGPQPPLLQLGYSRARAAKREFVPGLLEHSIFPKDRNLQR